MAESSHDHRKSIWAICGGRILWCYRCGAWRDNQAGRKPWWKPTGIDGKNPALKYLLHSKGKR